MNLKPDTLSQIDALIPRYPEKRSAVMPLLHHIQAEEGFISNEAIEWVAEKLELQPINVYDVVTFYPWFRQKPVGRTHVRVCRTLPCALAGGYHACEELSEQLDCPVNGTAEDGSVTIEFVECLASCGTGPVALVDDDLVEKLNDDEQIRKIVERVRSGTTETSPARG